MRNALEGDGEVEETLFGFSVSKDRIRPYASKASREGVRVPSSPSERDAGVVVRKFFWSFLANRR